MHVIADWLYVASMYVPAVLVYLGARYWLNRRAK